MIGLADAFIPPAIIADPKLHSLARRYQGVARMLITIIMVMSLYVIPLLIWGAEDGIIAAIILALVALVGLSLLLLYITRNLILPLIVANFGTIALIIYGMFVTGGISSPLLFVMLTLPVITITFGDGKLFALLCSSIAIGIVGVFIAQQTGFIAPVYALTFTAFEQFLTLIGTFSLTSIGGVLAKREIQSGRNAVRAATQRAEREARIDVLTGLANRRAFTETVNKAIALSARRNFNQSTKSSEHSFLLMLDIDYFKRVNDSYGHSAGDIVLAEVAKALKIAVRDSEFVARLGGEEFAILVECDDIDAVLLAGERFRACIENLVIEAADVQIEITTSVGVGQMAAGDSLDSLLQKADTSLYSAKEQGRNCVVFTAC